MKMKDKVDVKKYTQIAYTLMVITGLYVIATSGWILYENRKIITIMEILTIWAALVIVQFMAVLYQGCSESRKRQGLLALIFSISMATITIMNHIIYITVLTQLYAENKMPSWLLLDGWPSISKGLECVAWGFFLGLAMLYASKALEDLGSKAISWTMRISGILTLAGLIGLIIPNMYYYLISTVGYSVGFLVISIELVVYFKGKSKSIS